MSHLIRPCRSVVVLVVGLGLSALALDRMASRSAADECAPVVGPCENSLFEPCPHCAEPGEEAAASPLAPPSPSGVPAQPSLAFTEQSGAFGGPTFTDMQSIAGYMDDAVIRSRVRMRYDYAQNASFPDRAEFFYPSSANNGGRGPVFGFGDNALDFQEIRTYVEWAWSPIWSVFGEFPVRFVNADADGFAFVDPISRERTDTVAGAGDVTAGLRVGLIVSPEQYLTAQFKVYAPTADPQLGLGTGHTSVETGLLYQRRLADRWTVFGEVQDWVAINASRIESAATPGPLDGQLFGGNVLRYGAGLGYDLWSSGPRLYDNRLVAVGEVVGWSVLDGFKTDANLNILDAEGDTIVNGKFGLRYNFGRNTVYAGYGSAWTDERWYSDIVRIELGHFF